MSGRSVVAGLSEMGEAWEKLWPPVVSLVLQRASSLQLKINNHAWPFIKT